MEPIPLRDVAVFAGAGEEKHADGPRLANAFFRPRAVVSTSSGELFVADSGNHRIRFINKYGYVSTHAGDGRIGLKNGRMESASFNHPSGICRSSQGHLLISDSGNHVIRIVTTQGMAKTYAGTGEIGDKDGPASEATFNAPGDLCIDFQGQLYICDTGNHRIRMISSSRIVHTVTGSVAGYKDGARDEALFNSPVCARLTPTRMGTLLIADTGNHCIRLLKDGYVTTFAGRCEAGFHAIGKRSDALFHTPVSLTIGSDESVYVSDAENHCIYHLAPNGMASILSGGTAGCQDGSKEQAAFKRPGGICHVGQRQLILAETGHGRILVIKPDGSVVNFAGRSRAGTLDGPVAKSTFFKPQALFSASSNDLLIADSMGHKIRRIRNGSVTTFAGAPERGAGNGRKDLANFDSPTGLCISPSNIVYVADTNNHVIRHIADGSVFTFAGTGVAGFADGPGTVAQFNTPIGLILIPSALLVADSQNHRIRHIAKDATVSTYAGGSMGFRDGPALTQASFNGPTELIYAPNGCVYVSDHFNHAIRMIKPDGMVSTIVGNGSPGSLDGPADLAQFDLPRGLAITPDGSLLVADTGNRAIRLVSPTGMTTTFVSATEEDDEEESDDEPEQVPAALSLTTSGVLFIADMLRNQILYLPCPQWDLTRQTPRAKDFLQFFDFTALAHAPAESFDFRLTHHATGTVFSLHSFFIKARCPSLLTPEVTGFVESTQSQEAVEHLIRLLYSDTLSPFTKMSQLPAACELAYLTVHLERPRWTWLVKHHISEFLQDRLAQVKRRAPSDVNTELQSLVNDCCDLLLHIYANCGADQALIDLILNFVKSFSRGAFSRSRTPSLSSPTHSHSSDSPATSGTDASMISFKLPKMAARHPKESSSPQIQQGSQSPSHSPQPLSPLPSHPHSPRTPSDGSPRSPRSPTPHSTDGAPHSPPPSSGFTPDFSRLSQHPDIAASISERLQSSSLESLGQLSDNNQHTLTSDMTRLYQRLLTSNLPNGSGDGSNSSTLENSAPNGDMDVDATNDSDLEPDFVLQIGTYRFPCHKMILFARWPHFANVLRGRAIDLADNVLELRENPLSPEVVEHLIRYLYTNDADHLPQTESFCLGVLKSSLLYDFVTPGDASNQPVRGFELLMSFCRHALMHPLTIENCSLLLSTLYEYGSVTQQNRVISYISRNLKQVMESPEAAKALAAVPSQLHSKIMFSHFSMLQALEEQ